jgi:hypothetical protein
MKISIKREQSQASLSFAERKKFRPKVKQKQLLFLLALLITAATGAWAQESETYAVKMKAGTEDAKNWTITSGQKSATGDNAEGLTGLSENDPVTLNYSGRLKVKSVTAVQVPDATDLSMLDCAGTPRTDGRWTANCYMVHTAGKYRLPLVYGNAIKAGQANTAAYTGVESDNTTVTFPNHAGEAINAPWITKKTTGTGVDKGMGIAVTSAELLWQDADGLVTAVDIDGDYLTLTVGKDATTKEGNAVVAAKDADGTIVWSWHIWVTKQTFADADLTTITTTDDTQSGTQGVEWQIYKVTPVNLGWVGDNVSTGTNTFYQWGRKDPFIGTGDVEFVESTTATIADNIKNPTKFYNVKYEKTTNKIHNNPCIERYYNLWNATQPQWDHYSFAEATVKTVYDPCPAGFCVPTSNLYCYFQDYIGEKKTPHWDATNEGFSLNIGTSNLFFPATGQRDCTNNGKFGDSVGIHGRYWSAYAYGDKFADFGYILFFFYKSDSEFGKYWGTANQDRAYGFPVRAVAEAPVAGGE